MTGTISLVAATRDLTDLEIRQRIADWVEWYRRSNHMTQAQLALELGKKEGTVSRFLRTGRGAGAKIWPLLRIRLHMDMNMMLDRPAPTMPDDRPLRSVSGTKRSDPPLGKAASAPSRTPATRNGSGR